MNNTARIICYALAAAVAAATNTLTGNPPTDAQGWAVLVLSAAAASITAVLAFIDKGQKP